MITIRKNDGGKTCPFCQFPIKDERQLIYCPSCKVPHHFECWEQNEGCTTYGCREKYNKSMEVISIDPLLEKEGHVSTGGWGLNKFLAAAFVITFFALLAMIFAYTQLLLEQPGDTAEQRGSAADNGFEDAASFNAPVEHPEFVMVTVGNPNTIYTIPTGRDDKGTAEVEGGFEIATTPVTYELWYEVRQWAEANGYYFAHPGREGSAGITGQAPSAARAEPVTNVSARDCMVWLNALSHMHNLAPVYCTDDQQVIRDARDSNAIVIDNAKQAGNNGYRFPTSLEWEMAARWQNDPPGSINCIELGGRWWTPGNFASGASDSHENIAATGEVAWHNNNSDTGAGRQTQPVGQKKPNALGLYDMNGNVWEHCFTIREGSNLPGRKISRGGSWNDPSSIMQIGLRSDSNMYSANDVIGFRIARTP